MGQPLRPGQSVSGSYHAPPGISQPPTGSYPVITGTGQPKPGSYPPPPGTKLYPSDLHGNAYLSSYATAGVNNLPGQGEYRTHVTPRPQQQYYPPQAAYEQGNINASYEAPPNYNEEITQKTLQTHQEKIE